MFKKAEMTLFAAILAFAIILMLTPGIEILQTNQNMYMVEENIEETLRDVIISNSIINYDIIKCNNNKADNIDEEKYVNLIFSKLGYKYSEADKNWKKEGTVINDAKITFNPSTYIISLKYNLSIPVKILNKEIERISADKEVQAVLNYKG